METQYTYQIRHIQLQQPLSLPALEEDRGGQYLVYWWQSIPLGHLFLEPGTVLSFQEYQERVLYAVRPSLEFYAQRSLVSVPEKPNGLPLQPLTDWVNDLEVVLQDFLPETLPDQVPVSVVICTCNRPQQLAQCLERFTHLACLPQELLVVDNAPKDDATKEVVRQFAGVRYVREPQVGLDVARNTGARLAHYPVVAFVDDDVTIHEAWLYQVWETFQDPKVAAMTGLVLAAELKSEAQCIFEKHWSFNRGFLDKTFEAEFFRSTFRKGPPVWKIGAGANMAFRKSVFEDVGYFDELLDAGAAGCNGDSEMWYRILAKGHTIHYNPRAVVFHAHREGVQELKRQIFNYMRGHTVAALVQRQHQRAGYLKYLIKLFVVSYSRSAVKGFPAYNFRYRTLWAQITGVVAGFGFYLKHKVSQGKITMK
ncbi:family 2 glycosyl transferase [Rufibacter radiotolerans]|uniref:Family 2 glycosyl transferase n=1 Tax=Rufibacter radiotolerans TaxID=1379910 RepID=A0A0H4W309_9BACT|nr:glycosyltransferase [Rufibacter radiotolerans]AKQ44831.1 family 2 glycosyl transferase [Rufibacter radiotolerans]